MVVTIDGPGGVGKSSVSRAVAALKGMKHLDTGAYYRAATFVTLRSGASVTEPESVVAAIDEASFDFESGRMWLDGEDVSEAIRGDGVTAAVSTVAAMPAVRSRMVDYQRAWAARARRSRGGGGSGYRDGGFLRCHSEGVPHRGRRSPGRRGGRATPKQGEGRSQPSAKTCESAMLMTRVGRRHRWSQQTTRP